jgi:hypothetical protein
MRAIWSEHALENHEIFRIPSPTDDEIALLRQYNITFGDEYIVNNGLQVKRERKELESIITHCRNTSYGSPKITRNLDVDNLEDTDNIITVPKPYFQKMIKLFYDIRATYQVTKEDKILDDIIQQYKDEGMNKIIHFEEYVEQASKEKYLTSEGKKMTPKQLVKSKKKIVLFNSNEVPYLHELKNTSYIYVITANDDAIFKIVSCFIKEDKPTSSYFLGTHNGIHNRMNYVIREFFAEWEKETPHIKSQCSIEYYRLPDYSSSYAMPIISTILYTAKTVSDVGLRRLFTDAIKSRDNQAYEDVKELSRIVLDMDSRYDKVQTTTRGCTNTPPPSQSRKDTQ